MNTPVADFLENYAASQVSRLHMPGHKGQPFLGCEALDITEVAGADVLGQAQGILCESQQNATRLFGTGKTLFSAGGSSQCVRAMLALALTCRRDGALPRILAARNVHKSYVYGAALLGLETQWLWPEGEQHSLCACAITPESLDRALTASPAPVAGVYVTSPDYLGNFQDIAALAEVAHRHGTLLLVDNAHGAYLHFLPQPQHPMDLGADLCCDSAHKTLPVLTGGAYLHISAQAPQALGQRADQAMALFASTSPSYLILGSLDLCNRYMEDTLPQALPEAVARMEALKEELARRGWSVLPSDPLRLTVHAGACGISGEDLAQRLREHHVECEFADRDYLVLMATPQNPPRDFDRAAEGFGLPPHPKVPTPPLPLSRPQAALSPREAILAPQETIPLTQALGRISASPVVSCPPAVPITVSGEVLDEAAIALYRYYGYREVDVVCR